MKKIHVTILADKTGRTIERRDMELNELNRLIQKTTADKKEKLKWLKLARFGEKRSVPGRSLRTDANVEAISGIELDYDDGVVSFETAIKVLKKAKVLSIVYTTASHSAAKPKWRVLCPTSEEYAKEDRAQLVARINGLFGGIFADESFVISQGYLFGSVKGNKLHRSVVVNGKHIDMLDALDARAIGKGGARAERVNGHDFEKANQNDLERLSKNIREGVNLHNSIRDIAAKLARQGFSEEKIIEHVEGEMNKSKAKRDKRFKDRFDDIGRSVKSGLKKFKGKDIEDFISYKPQGNYIFVPTREFWPANSVNTEVAPVPIAIGKKPIPASRWLDYNRAAHQSVWAPGLPLIINDKLVSDGGWSDHRGFNCVNLYKPPIIESGDASDVKTWLDHIRLLYRNDLEHIVNYFAFKVQHPDIKINHGILMGGMEGVGKDTILEPVKQAVGPWNFKEVNPKDILDKFNPHIKAVILRISEGRDMGDVNRYALAEHMKTLLASPPDTMICNEKNLRQQAVLNIMGVVITTNHKTDGIYLSPNDRRHYCAWTDSKASDFTKEYFNKIYDWYGSGGFENVAAYLRTLDLSNFNPKAPPLRTETWHAIVSAGSPPEESELADILDDMGNPAAVTIEQISEKAQATCPGFYVFLADRKNRRAIPHRMETCNYAAVRNKDRRDGFWIVNKKRQIVYVNQSVTPEKRYDAARRMR